MYIKHMAINNETLAELICQVDQNGDWVYNEYCSYCGRYLYIEESVECKKCHTSVKSAIKRPLPFMTSGTAIEKLLLWVRNKYIANRDDCDKQKVLGKLLQEIQGYFESWMSSDLETYDYHQAICEEIANTIEMNKGILCHI